MQDTLQFMVDLRDGAFIEDVRREMAVLQDAISDTGKIRRWSASQTRS